VSGRCISDPSIAEVPAALSRVAALDPAPKRRADAAGLGHWLRRLVGGLDRCLRRLMGIAEYSTHPDCLLRAARAVAGETVRLADGCRIDRGAAVLELHLWNERLSTLPSRRRGLGRASALRRRLLMSLRELARRLEADPTLLSIAAVRACAGFVPRQRVGKALHIARAFGFDTAADPPSASGSGRSLRPGEILLCWALAWAFNPAVLRRGGLARQCCELWISREGLLARYGARATRRGSVSQSGDGR
jgi:hypothetical protein